MLKNSDIEILKAEVEFLPAKLRLPLKFGAETIDSVVCGRAKVTVRTRDGQTAHGWGETPLSVGWGWPSQTLGFGERETEMIRFCRDLAAVWEKFVGFGHPMELGYRFNEEVLPKVDPSIPHLAQLICNSLFDLAMHDAYGRVHEVDTYATYNEKFMNCDLAAYFDDPAFAGKYPADYFVPTPEATLPVWHLVGGKDLLRDGERTGSEPDDGYPVTLTEWIERDQLKCLKVKLTGSNAAWDYQRMVDIGEIALEYDVDYLSPDFNCLVKEPAYVNEILDRLMVEHPRIYGMVLYVEQPFPYDLEANRIDVHSVSARKPLFMDESAHDWRFVRMGRELGWTGVALKVCKTQTGAVLSGCWAKEKQMLLMVQDLTNPMLAVVPHVRLAAQIGTIMGVECNAPQFYPASSVEFEKQHPGLYRRRNGVVDLSTLGKKGFGYTHEES